MYTRHSLLPPSFVGTLVGPRLMQGCGIISKAYLKLLPTSSLLRTVQMNLYETINQPGLSDYFYCHYACMSHLSFKG